MDIKKIIINVGLLIGFLIFLSGIMSKDSFGGAYLAFFGIFIFIIFSVIKLLIFLKLDYIKTSFIGGASLLIGVVFSKFREDFFVALTYILIPAGVLLLVVSVGLLMYKEIKK